MSWKKYSGRTHYDSQTDIRNHSITTDNLSLLGAIEGPFTIHGPLDVSGSTQIGGDVDIAGNTNIDGDVGIGGNLDISGSFSFRGEIEIKDAAIFNNNLTVKNNFYLYKYLYFDASSDNYFYGTQTGIGLNTNTPISTFDISSASSRAINVYSNTSTATNILAKNNTGNGISLNSDSGQSYIDFFNSGYPNANSINSTIRSLNGGYLQIDNLTKLQVKATTVISPAVSKGDANSGLTANLNNETLAVYTTFDASYLYNNYQVSTAKKGNAISVIASDNSSVGFINLSTPGKMGGAVGGGVAPYDTTKSLLSAGITNVSGQYIPHNTIVSGTYTNRLRATMGVNTFLPSNQYIMDVNGPVNLRNGECYQANLIPNFKVNRAVFCKTNRNIGYACCTKYGSGPYTYPVLSTRNTSGISWNVTSYLAGGNIETQNVNINAICIYNESTAFVAGGGYIFYTTNYGALWTQITGTGLIVSNTIYSIYACTNASYIRVFLSYYSNGYKNGYFDITSGSSNISSFNSSFGASPTQPSFFDGIISSSYVWYTYNNTINKIPMSNPSSVNATYTISGLTGSSFVGINVVNDNYVIAITQKDIVTIMNGNATNVVNWGSSVNFNYIDCLDTTNAIIYDSGTKLPLYTTNGANTWKYVDYNLLNSNGMANIVFQKNPMLSMIIYDINNIVVFDQNSDGVGCTIYYCYLPQLFGFASNTVFNVVGNISQSGIVQQW